MRIWHKNCRKNFRIFEIIGMKWQIQCKFAQWVPVHFVKNNLITVQTNINKTNGLFFDKYLGR